MRTHALVVAAHVGAASLLLAARASAEASAVPTFHSIGLAWSDSGGSASTTCRVEYRKTGEAAWKRGYPLWFDARAAGSGTSAARPANEYRGSLVNLAPGTAYEIRLSLEGTSTETTLTASTWSETFPVGETHLVTDSSDTLQITASGSKDAYVIYGPADGKSATIDVANAKNNDVYVDAAYVIVRGLTLKGAATNAIELGPNAHDVVIEGNDISGFGVISTVDGAGTLWGSDSNAAVYCSHHPGVERIVIQRNRIHNPRSDTNSWEEPRPSRGGDPHPLGPQAVTFETCGGNHVIRYNEVWSDIDHYFQDVFGGGENFSFEGFPRADSDIYGNRISNCWDDGIEAEGGDRNVRIWGNFIDHTFTKVATAAASVGPIYIFRNIAGVSRRSPSDDPMVVDSEDRGPFHKCGSSDEAYRGGRIFLFHNTLLQPVDAKYTYPLGCGYGLEDSAGTMTGVFSRNNLLQVHKDWWASVDDNHQDPSNQFDFDLYDGKINAAAGQEAHGIHGVPKYVSGGYALDPSSPGFDVATALPGFNDDFVGKGPDMGAVESGGPAPEFGVDAGLASGAGVDAGDDASLDASEPSPNDAAAPGDAPASGDSGCGCRTSSHDERSPWPLLLLAILLRVRARPRAARSARAT